MKIKLLLLFLIATVTVEAQVTFHKTFGGPGDQYGSSVRQTNDGGYITTGYADNDQDLNIYLIKTDSSGDTTWTRTFGGAATDIGYSVQQTTDGGYIIAGQTFSFGAGLSDVYLIKTNSNGDLIWTKTFGTTDTDIGVDVQQTSDGGYFVSGWTRITNGGNDNVLLIRTDANGDSLWTKVYGGTDWIDGGFSQQTSDGGLIFGGAKMEFGSAYSDAWLMRTDNYGNILWSKTYGGNYSESGSTVQQTIEGGYILTGLTYSFTSGTNSDVYLIKTDANGSLLWSKTYGGGADDGGSCVQQTSDGGYIISGFTRSFDTAFKRQSYLIRTDANGDSVWTKVFGETFDQDLSVQQTSDGGFITTGQTADSTGIGDLFLVKTHANGGIGCNDLSTATIISSPATQVNTPNIQLNSINTIVTNPNTIVGSGGIDSTICSGVGINELTPGKQFLLSPNPASNQFTIHSSHFTIKNVEVYNVLGEKSFPVISSGEEFWTVECALLSRGIYFVKVETEKGSSVQKLVVE